MSKLKSSKNFSRPQLAIFALVFGLIGILIWKSFAAPNPNLPGDLNGDNTVNITDLSILLSDYGTSNTAADINSDGTVNVLDLSTLLSHYGQSISGGACTPSFGSFDYNNPPPACWQPYAANTPFNQLIPTSPKIASSSAAIMGHFSTYGWSFVNLQAAAGPEEPDDWAQPVYYSHTADPVYTIHCTIYACPSIEGKGIHIPASAKPGNNTSGGVMGDQAMAVIDQTNHIEYGFWKVSVMTLPSGGGTLNIGQGGMNSISTSTSNGLHNTDRAADTGYLAGMIRPEEIVAGQINHALAMTTPCTSRATFAYPADIPNGRVCSTMSSPQTDADAPVMGQRFQLDPSFATDSWLAQFPAWKKAILKAARDYGLYIVDTGGDGKTWGISLQSDATYWSFDTSGNWTTSGKMTAWALSQGATHYVNHTTHYDTWTINSAFDNTIWSHLRVIDPCVGQLTC